MPSTTIEKILARASGSASCAAGDYVWVTPDRIITHDLNYPRYRRMLKEMGFTSIPGAKNLLVTIDHTTHTEDQKKLDDHEFIRKDAAAQGVKWLLDVGRHGISHNVPLDLDLVKPGMLVLASDTRAPALGCAGAAGIAIGMGLATVLGIGKTWLRVPETLKVRIEGALRPGVMSRDVGQWVASQIGAEAGDYRCIEFHGPVIEQFDTDCRHTLCNAMVDIGVKTVICAPALSGHAVLLPDAGAAYAAEFVFDVSALELQVCAPPDPANVVPLSAMSETRVSSAFIGSCIGGKMEDMRAAAAVLKGRRVHPDVRLTVIPATQAIYQKCLEEGLLESFSRAGADISAGICGPCYGTYAPLRDGDVSISTATRNDPGRMGSEKAQCYIGNAAVVAASAVAGHICGPFELEPVA